MGKYFGTDGFRGEAGITLTADHAYKVGRFLGWYYNALRERNGDKEPARIVIGKDTRRSSYMFEYSLEGPHEGDDGGDFAISQRRKQGGGKDVQPGEQKAHGKDRESVAGQLPDHGAPAGEHRHHGVPGELREQKHRHGGGHREDHGGPVDLL